MKAVTKRKAIFLFIAMLLAWSISSLQLGGANAQSAIVFEETTVENNFPDGLVFETVVHAAGADIVSAKLVYGLRNTTSRTQAVVEIEPGQTVTLRYEWDTSSASVPPGSPVFYHWEVKDGDNERAENEDTLVYYDDIRYDWQILEGDGYSVWWHDRPASFGQEVFDLVGLSINEQFSLYQVGFDFPIRVIIYNNFDEFAAFQSFAREWVGGQAFPSLGLTLQIVESTTNYDEWLNDVVPHEVSHLYLYQAAYHPLTSIPAWFNEGLAQYNEFSGNEGTLKFARKSIKKGDYLRLYALTGSFGNDTQDVRLAYAESLSAVTYLVETYGEAGLASLMAESRKGAGWEKAMEVSLGRDIFTFEQDWLNWLGVTPGTYGTPTPRATTAPFQTFEMMVTPTVRPKTATPEAEVVAEAVTTALPPTKAATATIEPVVKEEVSAETNPEPESKSFCNSLALTLPLLGAAFVTRRRKNDQNNKQ